MGNNELSPVATTLGQPDGIGWIRRPARARQARLRRP